MSDWTEWAKMMLNTKTCPKCDGLGFVPNNKNDDLNCPVCNGMGRIKANGLERAIEKAKEE